MRNIHPKTVWTHCILSNSNDVKYNAKKSAVMIYRSMTLKGCTISNFKLNGMILHVVASYKYLGHYITDDLSDDDDINRQRRTLFVQGNIILRKFNMCSLGVKLTLFRTYCSPMYTAQLWWNYKKSTITKLQIAYHNIFKMFLGSKNPTPHGITVRLGLYNSRCHSHSAQINVYVLLVCILYCRVWNKAIELNIRCTDAAPKLRLANELC